MRRTPSARSTGASSSSTSAASAGERGRARRLLLAGEWAGGLRRRGSPPTPTPAPHLSPPPLLAPARSNESLYFCFGTTHFCAECHTNPGLVDDLQKGGRLPKCPAGPLGKQLAGGRGDCVLKGGPHPEPGEEHVLGCSICRNAATF